MRIHQINCDKGCFGDNQRVEAAYTKFTIDMVKTGQNIIRLRKKAGLSVKDLQGAFGFSSPQAIYKWQHGVTLPTIDNLVVLSALLGVTVDDIIVIDHKDILEK